MNSLKPEESKSNAATGAEGENGANQQLTRAQGEERKESPSRQNTLQEKKSKKRSDDSNRSKMIYMKPDVEYSRLYSLNYLVKIGEDTRGQQLQQKKRKRSSKNAANVNAEPKSETKPEDQQPKEESIYNTHINDFVPPPNSYHVIHTLIDSLVQQFNMEVNG